MAEVGPVYPALRHLAVLASRASSWYGNIYEMKKAKVSKGIVRMVWPWRKGDLVKELPAHYQGLNGKPVPDCIVEVPDNVKIGWLWNGKEYVPRVKVIPPKPRSDLLEVVAEKLGVSYDDLMAEVMARKKARHAAAKN